MHQSITNHERRIPEVRMTAGQSSQSTTTLHPNQRVQRENIIVCMIIPGPKQPKHMDTFIQPLVDELKILEGTPHAGSLFAHMHAFTYLCCIFAPV